MFQPRQHFDDQSFSAGLLLAKLKLFANCNKQFRILQIAFRSARRAGSQVFFQDADSIIDSFVRKLRWQNESNMDWKDAGEAVISVVKYASTSEKPARHPLSLKIPVVNLGFRQILPYPNRMSYKSSTAITKLFNKNTARYKKWYLKPAFARFLQKLR